MANEIYTSLSVRARKNGADVSFSGAYNITMSGNNLLNATQDIGTSAETVSLGDITGAPGLLLIKNLDSTNFVDIGGDSGLTVFKIRILAGHSALIQPTSGTLYAKADTAAVRIQKIATEA